MGKEDFLAPQGQENMALYLFNYLRFGILARLAAAQGADIYTRYGGKGMRIQRRWGVEAASDVMTRIIPGHIDRALREEGEAAIRTAEETLHRRMGGSGNEFEYLNEEGYSPERRKISTQELGRSMGLDDDVELMLTIGRALYRAALYTDCHDLFAKVAANRPDSADAAASLGYTLHRLGDDVGAGRQVKRALRLNPDLYEARIYLGHLLYDRGDWEGSLRELEQVPPQEHWDPLAVWRLMELKRTLWHVESGDQRLVPWEKRLNDLEELQDPIDRLLADVESRMGAVHTDVYLDPSQLELFEAEGEGATASRVIRLADGHLLRGNWLEIVQQMRDQAGFGHETVHDYMRRLAERWLEQAGVSVPSTDPGAFLRAAVQAGLIRLELEG